ncbi:hypothetical protein Ancab_030340 [Ancistrocladus abbreviatus]
MASAKRITGFFALLIVLQACVPALGDDVCNNVECGRGQCKASQHSAVGFVCECNAGWQQSLSGDTDGNDFMPCIFPNCTLNFSCTDLSPTPSPSTVEPEKSGLDPCRWVNCGGGSCKKLSSFRHTCDCAAGYHNVLNNPAFPCFKPCAYGADCSAVVNASASPAAAAAPAPAPNTDSGKIIAFTSLASLHHRLARHHLGGLMRKGKLISRLIKSICITLQEAQFDTTTSTGQSSL